MARRSPVPVPPARHLLVVLALSALVGIACEEPAPTDLSDDAPADSSLVRIDVLLPTAQFSHIAPGDLPFSTNPAVTVEEFVEIPLTINFSGRLAFDSVGNLMVGDFNSDTIIVGADTIVGGARIFRVTPTGAISTFALLAPEATGAVNENGHGPDLAFDAAGNLVVPLTNAFSIARVTPTGMVSVLADPATLAAGGGRNPTGGAVGPSGDAFAGNFPSGDIVRVTPGGSVSLFSAAPADGFSRAPGGMAFDAAGNLISADPIRGEVVRFDPGGARTVVTTYSPNTSALIDLVVDESGLFCDAGDYIFPNGNVLLCTDPSTGAIDTLAGGFMDAAGVAMSADGDLFVSDYPQDAIFRLDAGGTVTVNVTNQGTPVPGHVVTVVNGQDGPFRGNGTVTMAVTDANGEATIRGLTLPGNYCVHVRPLTSVDDATAFGTFVVPPGGQAPGPPGERFGGIAGASATVTFNDPNYQQICIDNPPISLDPQNQEATVPVVLEPPSSASTLELTFLDLEGNPTGLPGWAIVEKDPADVPWFPGNLDPDIVPALLQTAAPEENGVVKLTGLPPEEEVVIQSGIEEPDDPDQGVVTFTITETAPPPGQTTSLGSVVAEPQMCAVNRSDDEGEGEGPPGRGRRAVRRRPGIGFLPPIKDGFRADAQLNRLNQFAIFYSQSGEDGRVHLLMLFRLESQRVLPLHASYRCSDGDCELVKANGQALDEGVEVKAFFAPRDGDTRVTLSVSGVPADVQTVAYKLFTAGDRFPDQRSGPLPSFQVASVPDVCTGGLSNDPRFWVTM